MKVLISSCVLGNKVRWNKAHKKQDFIQDWAKENGIELIPVCPEDELFGTPRQNIRLLQIGEEVRAMKGQEDVYSTLLAKSKEIYERHPDAAGFIGVANSPSCGMSAGVKNRGSTMRGVMHIESPVTSVEVNHLKSENHRESFLLRMSKENDS